MVERMQNWIKNANFLKFSKDKGSLYYLSSLLFYLKISVE